MTITDIMTMRTEDTDIDGELVEERTSADPTDVEALDVEINPSNLVGVASDRTSRIGRRGVLQVMGGAGVVGVAGCLGSSDDGASGDGSNDGGDADHDEAGDDGTDDDDDDSENADDDDPYYREELENAMGHLDAPDPGTGVVVFENDGEYRTEDVTCEEDSEAPDDPEKGTAEGVFEFDDGEPFSVELSRIEDFGSLRNTITLMVIDPEGDGTEEIGIPRSLSPIKPEEGAEGSSAYVIREGETWYGGIEFDPSNRDLDFGETWVAITCG